MKIRIITIILCLFCFPASAPAQPKAAGGWSAGLGEGPLGRLEFRFEVTFMKIDVADIEARLDSVTATALREIVTAGRGKKGDLARAAEVLLAADSLAFGMTFLRDGDFDKFLAGTRKNLEASRKQGLITQAEFESVWQGITAAMATLVPRGAFKGDQLLYRVDPGQVWMGYVGADGAELLDVVHTGDHWARGIKGSFFSQDSRFRKRFLAPLWRE